MLEVVQDEFVDEIDQSIIKKFEGNHPKVVKKWLPKDIGLYRADPKYKLTRKQKNHRIKIKLEKLLGSDLSKKHFLQKTQNFYLDKHNLIDWYNLGTSPNRNQSLHLDFLNQDPDCLLFLICNIFPQLRKHFFY